MDLRDYPRPKGDTGIGVHWNAGFPAAIGLGDIRDKWLPELIAMGVKWVKLARHDGGIELGELFLKHDIMPIVRVYRPQPNPGVLDQGALRLVRDHVSAGVRYFEFNNEPDLPVEWQNEMMPPNALEIVARNAIVDIEAILQAGGYPGLPAMTVGSKWDLVGEICRQGRRDLLAEPVWQAIHNYSINHPLDYPYDPGNQQGAPYTEEFYRKLATEAWDGVAWGGWSLERVNQERREHANPGATAFDDPSCWRAYERYDRLIRDQIGRSLPILATENGYVVGERPDPRYPATTPLLHMAQTLEACRIMMGTSSRFDHAPDYYFCTAFWLLGNYTLGHWAPGWEGQAWYSSRWPNGQLPIVAALKAEPKQARPWRGDSSPSGQVNGSVTAGAGLTVRLDRADGWALTTRVAADGRFGFSDLPLGTYRVIVQETGHEQSVTLTQEHPSAAVDFDLTGIVVIPQDGVIRGIIRGGAGMKVGLARPADGWAQQQVIGADGSYRFAGLQAGTYVLALIGTEVARADIVVDGRSEMVIDLAVPGWGWTVADAGASPGFGVVRCRVTGRPDMAVRLWTVGWPGIVARTGTKPEYGPDVCEFAPLGAGVYSIQPQGVGVTAQVTLDGRRVLWVTFTETPAGPARDSAISGRVRNGSGKVVTLSGPDVERTMRVAADGSFEFGGLAPGVYRVWIEGTDVARDGIVLDGRNRVTVELTLPVSAAGVVFGVVTNGAGRIIQLLRLPDPQPVAEVRAGNDGSFRFERLIAGTYAVRVMGDAPSDPPLAERPGVTVDGTGEVRVDLALPGPVAPAWSVEDGGAGPGFSVVRCRAGEAGRDVRLWTSGWSGIVQRSGSKTEYGPDACEFAPLGPGTYFVELVGLDVRAEVKVEPNRVVWVRFAPPTLPAPPSPAKSFDHYLLVGSMARSREDFLAVVRYAARFQPVVGTDADEALKAYHVTILGGLSAVSARVEQDLRMSGCQVQRFEADYAGHLAALLSEGRPY